MILENYYYQLVCIFILGLIFGSFYNVLIVRTLKNESIIYPPSKCPACLTPLKWYHNIPILSYVFLRGKCAFCNKKIDIMYPLTELATGILFSISFVKYGVSLKALFCAITLSLFLILTGMDIKSKTISIKYASALILSAILFNYTNILSSVLGGLAAAGMLFLIKKLSEIVFEQETIGGGDIYAFAGLGCFAGITYIAIFAVITLFLQILINIHKHLNVTLIWFVLSYLIALLVKIKILYFTNWLEILIFINVIASFLILCKYLLEKIKNRVNTNREPFLPAIFLSAVLFLFLI